MSLQLHLLNARGRLDPIRERIEDAFAYSSKVIGELLPIRDIDVVLQTGPHVIPETGIGGYCPSTDVLYLTVDPENQNLFKDFEAEFMAMLGHELHHCLRHGGPGYGSCLAEALVSEGLACHFETELRGGASPFYARALEPKALEEIRVKAESELWAAKYDHVAWFYGSQEAEIPRHAGYSLGFSIVQGYISRLDRALASKLWDVEAMSFYGVA